MTAHATTPSVTNGPLSSKPFQPATRVRTFGPTVFAEYTALAIEHNAVNLGQGFPNFPAPDFIKNAAQSAVANDLNQYTRYGGHLRLVDALARFYAPIYGRELDPLREVLITVGATEGIFATMQALIEPGDEVILIEPFYDSYPAAVIMAGGTPVYIPLRPAPITPGQVSHARDWVLDPDELTAAFNERTRLIVINTPQNALGKVYTRAELEMIARLVQQCDAYVLSDEVYEWMVYPVDDADAVASPLLRMATLPGMWERTITLGSAGKTFSVTGWKIGWVIAPPDIIYALLMAHQWIPFTVATPLQEAVAVSFETAPHEGYFEWLPNMYRAKRDRLIQTLLDVGLTPIQPDGSYFILADTSGLNVPDVSGKRRDINICHWLPRAIGVVAIPPSHFYSPPHQYLTDNLVRFTFCKTDELLSAGAERLQKLTKDLGLWSQDFGLFLHQKEQVNHEP